MTKKKAKRAKKANAQSVACQYCDYTDPTGLGDCYACFEAECEKDWNDGAGSLTRTRELEDRYIILSDGTCYPVTAALINMAGAIVGVWICGGDWLEDDIVASYVVGKPTLENFVDCLGSPWGDMSYEDFVNEGVK